MQSRLVRVESTLALGAKPHSIVYFQFLHLQRHRLEQLLESASDADWGLGASGVTAATCVSFVPRKRYHSITGVQAIASSRVLGCL